MRIPTGEIDRYIYFVAVDATDLKTRETGLSSFTVYGSKNGAAAAVFTTPTVNETDATNMPGVYELLVDEQTSLTAGNDTEELCLHITATGMAPVTRTVEIYRPETTEGNTLTVESDGHGHADLKQWLGVAPLALASQRVVSDMGAISGDATAANNLEAILDGTGATLTLSQLLITANASGAAVIVSNSGTGGGVSISGGSVAAAVDITGSSSFEGLKITGGSGADAVILTGGTNANGLTCNGNGSGVDIVLGTSGTIETSGGALVPVDISQIGGSTAAAGNWLDMLDGTGATLTLAALDINANSSGYAIDVTQSGSGGALRLTGGTSALPAVQIYGNTTDPAFEVQNGGTGDGISIQSGSSGAGLAIQGFTTGYSVAVTNLGTGGGVSFAGGTGGGAGLAITGATTSGTGLAISGGATAGHGIVSEANGTGSYHGLYVSGATNGSGLVCEGVGTGRDIYLIGSETIETLSNTYPPVSVQDWMGNTPSLLSSGLVQTAVSTISTGASNTIADAILSRSASNVEDSASQHSLCELILSVTESSLSGSTWTIKKTDGITTFNTRTVTTDAAADPIIAVT